MTKIRIGAVALVALAALVLGALPAFAHVEPDPSRVKRGEQATVEFTPEHGCDDSVTTEMDFKVPKAAKDAQPEELDGWTTTVKGRRITFQSDKVPSEEQSFGITFTAPDSKTVLAWKVIQRCQDGLDRWIQGPDGEHPAPLVGVGKKPPAEEDSDEHG